MIKDTGYVSLFDKKDLPYIHRLAEKIQTTHNQALIDNFDNCLKTKWDDHHNHLLEIGNKKIELLQVSKSDDLVVNAGLDQCEDQILGASVTRWRYMNATDSNVVVTAADTTFPGAGTTTDMTAVGKGWTEYAGTSLRFGGIAGESAASFVILSSGVTTGPGSGILLNRNMFSNFPINHTQDVTGYVLSSIIEFVPVM